MAPKKAKKRAYSKHQSADEDEACVRRKSRCGSATQELVVCGMCSAPAQQASQPGGKLDQCARHGDFFSSCKGLTWSQFCSAYSEKQTKRDVENAIRASDQGNHVAMMPEKIYANNMHVIEGYRKFIILSDKDIAHESDLEPKVSLMQNVIRLSVSGMKGIDDGDYWAFPKMGPSKYPTIKFSSQALLGQTVDILNGAQIMFPGHGRVVLAAHVETKFESVGAANITDASNFVTLDASIARAAKKRAALEERRASKHNGVEQKQRAQARTKRLSMICKP